MIVYAAAASDGLPSGAPGSLSGLALLRMAGVDIEVRESSTGMSPSGELPLIVDNDSLDKSWHGWEGTVALVQSQEPEKAVLRDSSDLVWSQWLQARLDPLLAQYEWLRGPNRAQAEQRALGSLPWLVRGRVASGFIRNLSWHAPRRQAPADNLEEMLTLIEERLVATTDNLNSESAISRFHALAFGYLTCMLYLQFPDQTVSLAVQRHASLVQYVDQGLARWFDMSSPPAKPVQYPLHVSLPDRVVAGVTDYAVYGLLALGLGVVLLRAWREADRID